MLISINAQNVFVLIFPDFDHERGGQRVLMDDPFKAESSDSVYDDAKENAEDIHFEIASDSIGNGTLICLLFHCSLGVVWPSGLSRWLASRSGAVGCGFESRSCPGFICH